jgi:RND family efflux transporter MFP subunit
MCVTFGVPADVARFFEIGDAITLENGSVVHSAEIVEIATMVDSTSGLFTIKANVTDDSSDLLTGIAVKLTATTAHSDNTILIPTAALYYDDGNAYVYLAVDGIAVKTSVTTGIISGDEAEITAGIEDGDLVITTWSTNLRDGAAVTVQEV